MRRFVSNVLAIAYKETLVMRHDRGLMMTIAVQPFIMCLLFGGALSNDPRNVPWVVLDRSASPLSRRLVADIQATGYFLPVRPVRSYDEGIGGLRRGRSLAVLVVPGDFEREAAHGHARVQLLVDGSDPLTAARVEAAVIRAARAFPTDVRTRQPRATLPIAPRQRFWFNPTLDDGDFYLSVLSVMLLTNLCLSASTLALVGERESGTYEQTLAAPTTAIEIVLGKLAPHVVACYGVLVLATLLSGVIFGFWPRGHLLTLGVVALPFILASLSISVFVSSLARSSAQAVFIGAFFILPSFILSGVMLPYQFMPHPVRELGGLTPARWYQIASRAVVARGAGFLDVLLPFTVLWTMFAVMLVLVRWRMRPRLG